MKTQSDLINNLRVASPCHVGWEQMHGSAQVRFCDSCQRNVYNFADMTSNEIKLLLEKTEGGICGRMYQRSDGTILTRDCPVGLRAIRRRVARFAGAVFATLLSTFSISFSQIPGYFKKQPQVVELKINRSKTDKENVGKFSGVIVDINGAVITTAEVTLRDSRGYKKLTTFTDDTGSFTFKDVTDGRYMLKVSAPGFQTVIAEYVEVVADEFATTKITLTVAPPQTTIPETLLTGFVIQDPVVAAGNTPLLQPANRKPATKN